MDEGEIGMNDSIALHFSPPVVQRIFELVRDACHEHMRFDSDGILLQIVDLWFTLTVDCM